MQTVLIPQLTAGILIWIFAMIRLSKQEKDEA